MSLKKNTLKTERVHEKNNKSKEKSNQFKKEKAKVLRIDKQKEEVVISLLGAVVPLSVTVKLDNVKVIRREEGEENAN